MKFDESEEGFVFSHHISDRQISEAWAVTGKIFEEAFVDQALPLDDVRKVYLGKINAVAFALMREVGDVGRSPDAVVDMSLRCREEWEALNSSSFAENDDGVVDCIGVEA